MDQATANSALPTDPQSASEVAFQFLLEHEGQPFQPSRCYIVADPAVNDRRQWALELDPPEEAEWTYRIDDIKAWMLHGDPMRQIIFDRKNPQTPYRDLQRDEVFRAYLRKVLERLPVAYQSRRKYALMPSIADEFTRNRYKSAVEDAIPGVTVVPEPEMVAEYFRLVKRTLELEHGRNNVLFVVDVGASTANMTLILSRRDSTILDIDEKGAQRDLRLRALRGDSIGHAGRWVDLRLAELLETGDSNEALREIEKAKVSSSVAAAPIKFNVPGVDKPVSLSPETLTSVSGELWNELKPLFARLCERLYENQTSTEDAKRKSQDLLRDKKVNAASDAHRLIDTVLLAGGTSLLPGFQDAMMATLFPDGDQPKVLHVGSSFAIAAAAGGLAHILHNYDPPRLRESNLPEEEVFTAMLESTLPYPLELGVKLPGEREERITVLDLNDPFADDGGRRRIQGLPALAKGSQPKMRLVPGQAAGIDARKGKLFKAMHVHESPGIMELEWNPASERAMIYSDQVDGTGSLWIEANSLRRRSEPALDPFNEPLAPGTLAVDTADDVVLDLGMSKIVAVTARRGWISAEELERVMRDGLVDKAPSLETASGGDNAGARPPSITGVVSQSTSNRHRRSTIATNTSLADTKNRDDADSSDGSLSESVVPVISERETGNGEVAAGSNYHYDWSDRVEDAVFSHALANLRDFFKEMEPNLRFDDIVVALLALAVRPVVLLSGPPGCGKSTLVRLIARILGKRTGETFHEVAVQAHWESDDVLFGKDGVLAHLLEKSAFSHLVLFDEFNLTRPEYYMSQLFHALDGGNGIINRKSQIAPCRVFGTLNIDDSSRPPSPKIIDRCFLLELTQVPWDTESPAGFLSIASIPSLPGLPTISNSGASTDGHIATVLTELQKAVHQHDLRHDLLPSHRVLSDIKAILSLHHRLDLQAKGLLKRDDLVDRLIASRILVKISGAVDQLKPALEALETAVQGVEELPRTNRRLKLARQQARLGFISPWQ